MNLCLFSVAVRGHPAEGADGPCSFYPDCSSHEAVLLLLLLLLCPGAEFVGLDSDLRL